VAWYDHAVPAEANQDYVTLAELAESWGIDRSAARKWAIKEGVAFRRVRTPQTRGQATLALTLDEAEALTQRRRDHGYSENIAALPTDQGVFYVVQLVPDLKPNRVKLGFAQDAETRLRGHQTAAPTATLLKTWPARAAWEFAAIASVTREGCQHISDEVYDCENLQALVNRADAFFALMPGSYAEWTVLVGTPSTGKSFSTVAVLEALDAALNATGVTLVVLDHQGKVNCAVDLDGALQPGTELQPAARGSWITHALAEAIAADWARQAMAEVSSVWGEERNSRAQPRRSTEPVA